VSRIACPRHEGLLIGEAVFGRGGNAVDALVAASFAQAVAEPYMCGLGGVAEMVVREPDGRVHVIDAIARAPLAARPDMYRLGEGFSDVYPWPRVEGDANVRGPLSVAAPRTVAALGEAHARFGALEWASLVRPAAELAATGIEFDFFSAAVIAAEAATLREDPLAARLYYRDGLPLPAPIERGTEVIRNEALAEALLAVAAEGPAALSQGSIGRSIIAAVKAGGGILAAEDLVAATAEVIEDVEPLVDFRGWGIYGSPRPSGAVTAAQMLGLVGQADPAAVALSPARFQAFARASHLAFEDRLAGFAGGQEDASAWLAGAALRERWKDPLALTPHVDGGSRIPTSTTHAVAVDDEGRVAVVTQTLLGLFGAQVGVEDVGFFLNDGMLWFDPRPGSPNSIAPGARALAAVSPVIAVAPDAAVLLGVAGLGARKIPGAVAQVTQNVIDFDMDAEAAVNSPRVHVDTTVAAVDRRLGPEVFSALAADGLEPEFVRFSPTAAISARAGAVLFDPASRRYSVGIDLRSQAVWNFGNEGGLG
jgi:gamma-glutamyltranspeptidase / glutathione hydrolase